MSDMTPQDKIVEALRELVACAHASGEAANLGPGYRWYDAIGTAENALAEHDAQPKAIDDDIDALSLAIMFHHTYERLAPSVGYDTRVETRIFDPESPNGKLMLAVCADLLPKLRAQPQQERTERERFEAWAVAATPFGTQRNDEGFYQSSWMRNAWAAWQAALAQRTPTSSNAAAPTKQPKE